MTLRLCDLCFFKSANSDSLSRGFRSVLFAAVLSAALTCVAQNKPAANPAPDVLVLANGDTLHGKFVSSIQGTITFHSDPLGDLTLTWDKIKEIHTGEKMAVIDKSVKLHGRKSQGNIPIGTVEVENKAITIHTENAPTPPPIPEANAPYIVDEPPGLLGDDTAPNPSEASLAALGSCLAVGLHANAVHRGWIVNKLELELEGDLNITAVWGTGDVSEKPVGFTDVRVKVDMECEGIPKSEIDALVAHVKKWSPVANTFTRPVNLEVSAS